MGRSIGEATGEGDAALIGAVRHGDTDAYGELFRRHHVAAVAAARAIGASPSDAEDLASEAFARVLRAIQAGGGPDVAFRPYLLTAVRNAARDRARRQREDAVGDPPELSGAGGFDEAERRADAGLAATAFATLPERWQMVLWHTEVEGMTPAQVAPLLGIAPNAAAALAYRAREGLRQAYLQAHLRVQDDIDCQRCVEQLGPYVRDGLSARDRRKVDEHLHDCNSCRAVLLELRDTNSTLRAALIPLVLGIPAAASANPGAGGGVVAWFGHPPKRTPSLLTATAGAGVAGIVGLVAWVAAVGFDGGSPPPEVAGVAVSVPVVASEAPLEPLGATTAPTPPSPATTAPRPPAVTSRPAPTPPVAVSPVTTLSATSTPTAPVTITALTTVAPPVASLSLSVSPLLAPLRGGQFDVAVAVRNTGATAVPRTTLSLPLPDGVSLVSSGVRPQRAEAVDVSCTGSVCTSGPIAAGESVSVVVSLAVRPTASSPLVLRPAITEPADARVDTPALSIDLVDVPALQFHALLRGTVVAIGNTSMTCADQAAGCAEARGRQGSSIDRFAFPMVNVGATSTAVNVSSADLVTTGRVLRAWLSWSGDLEQGGAAPDPTAAGTVGFTTPSGTSAVVGSLTTSGDGRYAAVADVSALVTGAGTYTVSDVQTAEGVGSFAGWSLMVVVADDSEPPRQITVSTPLAAVPGRYELAVPLASSVTEAPARVVLAVHDGDAGVLGEWLTFGDASLSDLFVAAAPGPRVPADLNTFGGVDVAVVDARLSGPSAVAVIDSEGEVVTVATVALLVDVEQR